MAKISKEEIALLKEMIADPSVPNDEKDLYRETLSQFVEVKDGKIVDEYRTYEVAQR